MWAKELLFAKLFGDKNQENDLNARSTNLSDNSSEPIITNIFDRRPEEDLDQYGQKIFDHVFGHNIEASLVNKDTWKNRNKPKPIYIKDLLLSSDTHQNGAFSDSQINGPELSAMNYLGLNNSQEIWSLADNMRVFLESLKLFLEKREKVRISITLV